MRKILFLIHDLGHGGAEKVLVNLVNNMDAQKFDITVMAIFGGGINEQFLESHIHYRTVFKKSFLGNSYVMKLFSPQLLHKMFIKEHYDIEISYLEGPSARVISGCTAHDTKLVSWIHVEQHDMKKLSSSFRNEEETVKCYKRFDNTVCVSNYVYDDFCRILNFNKPCCVLYNTVESKKIIRLSEETVVFDNDEIKLVAVATLKPNKGYIRLLNIMKKLLKTNNVHLYILGEGPQRKELERCAKELEIEKKVSFLGYQTNPYKYVSKCDLFVCASFAEGFSTAATEALIVGIPVCTVEVSGMKEMLGEDNEWGLITENDEEALYKGIKSLLDNPELLTHYKERAVERGKTFNTENTVKAVETMLINL